MHRYREQAPSHIQFSGSTSRASNAEPRHLPWASSASERVTPPRKIPGTKAIIDYLDKRFAAI